MPRTYSQRTATDFIRHLERYLERKEYALHLQEEFAQNISCLDKDAVVHKLQQLYRFRGRVYVPNLDEQAEELSQIPDIDVRLRDGNFQLVEDIARVLSARQNSTELSNTTIQTALQFCHLHAPEFFPEWDEVSDWLIKAYQKANHLRPIANRVGQIANKIILIRDVYDAVRDELRLGQNASYDTIKDAMYDALLTTGIILTRPEVINRLRRVVGRQFDELSTDIFDDVTQELAFELMTPMPILRVLLRILIYFVLRHIVNNYAHDWHEELTQERNRFRAHAPPAHLEQEFNQ